MKIEYNPIMFKLEITDEDRASWRKGTEVYYKMPKDSENWLEQQPNDFNPYNNFDGRGQQAIYELEEIAHRYPINKCPKIIEDTLEIAKKIAKIYDDFIDHALAVCLDPENKI